MLSVVKLSVFRPRKLIEGERSIKEKGTFEQTDRERQIDRWMGRQMIFREMDRQENERMDR
jgi:hypothetical protein